MSERLSSFFLFITVPKSEKNINPTTVLHCLFTCFSRVFQKMLYVPPKEPAPPHKDATMKAASKLKAFIKRSSEPLLNMQPQQVEKKISPEENEINNVLICRDTVLSNRLCLQLQR